jgi:hypothetical protein
MQIVYSVSCFVMVGIGTIRLTYLLRAAKFSIIITWRKICLSHTLDYTFIL